MVSRKDVLFSGFENKNLYIDPIFAKNAIFGTDFGGTENFRPKTAWQINK